MVENGMRDIDYLKEDYHNSRHWALNDRSEKIVEYFKKYANPNDSILELGCSSGRNLIFLKKAGFNNLTGLEMFPVKERPEFKLIRGRWEETELEKYDIIFSASFLQEFHEFPQELFNKTLQKCRKYFMIFGDYMKNHTHEGFKEVEKIPAQAPFSEPIIILKCQDKKQ